MFFCARISTESAEDVTVTALPVHRFGDTRKNVSHSIGGTVRLLAATTVNRGVEVKWKQFPWIAYATGGDAIQVSKRSDSGVVVLR